MAQSTLRGKRSVPLTTSNVLAVVREVKRWWGGWESESLTRYLYIPESKLKEIMANFPDEMDQKQQAISYWIDTDPLASWRRLIIALDWMEETELADSIRSNAEPLTTIMFGWLMINDDSLTPHSVAPAVATVRQFWGLELEIGLLKFLGVPQSVMEQIRDSRSYSSEEEKRVAGLQYCLQTVPGVSWGRIAGVLWYLEEHTALETVRQYLPDTHDISLTLSNLTSALDSLPDKLWRAFGIWMDVPKSILDKIRSQLSSDKERKAEMLRVISTKHPHLTWEHVSDALYQLGRGEYHHVLERVQSLFPTGKQPPSVAMAATTPPPTSPDSTQELDIDDHFDVVSELGDVAHVWKSLGGALRLRQPILDRIERERQNDLRRCLSEMVIEWLNQSYNTERFGLPSWKMLVEAVAHRNGGNNNALARDIATKYNVPAPAQN